MPPERADLLAPTILIGAALVASTDLAVTATGEGESGLASALVNTSQQIGGVLGLAVLATVAASRTQGVAAAGGSLPVAMTAGFSWVFLGAAAFSLAAAAVALIMTPRAAVAAPEPALAWRSGQ